VKKGAKSKPPRINPLDRTRDPRLTWKECAVPATQPALGMKQSDNPVALLGDDRLVLIPVLSTSRYGTR